MAGPSASHVTSADIRRMLLQNNAASGSINFSESGSSNVGYAQEENWNETDEVSDDIVARQ